MVSLLLSENQPDAGPRGPGGHGGWRGTGTVASTNAPVVRGVTIAGVGRSADRRSPAPLLAGAIVAGYGLAALAVARGPGALTTYAGAWPAAAALGAAAGIPPGAAGGVAPT